MHSTKREIGKGASYLYIETLASMIAGYAFWLIITKISTAEVIGISSAVVSLATIFATISTLGIPTGSQRFLAKGFSEKNTKETRSVILSSTVLVIIGIVACGVAILLIHKWIGSAFKITFDLIVISVILIASSSFTALLRSVLISSLNTKSLPLILILSALGKIAVAIVLVFAGTGAVGVTVGFTSFSVFASILLVIVLMRPLQKTSSFQDDKTKTAAMFYPFNSILRSGFATWIPAIIYTVGLHLGPVLVFGSEGAGEAGVYFIAFSIVIAVSAVIQVLSTIAFPALSTMRDGHKLFTWRVIKLSLIVATPLSAALIFYADEIMLVFGPKYDVGGSSLSILMLSIVPIGIASGINSLVYARGNYKQVLQIGLASNVPRVVLYFMFLPYYGATGAAISYTLGSICGLIVSLMIGKKIGFSVGWKDIAALSLIPCAIAFILSYLSSNFVFGMLLTLLTSYLVLIKLNIVNKEDLNDFLAFLPSRISRLILFVLNTIGHGSRQDSS